MNTKLRAIIWEQSRVTGILTVWCLAVTALINGAATLYRIEDSELLTLYCVIMASVSFLFLFRQDHSGYLKLDFERRLARLPLSTDFLAVTTIVVNCGFLVVFGGGALLLHLLCHGYLLPYSLLLMFPALYALAKGFVWARNGLLYLPMLALAGGALAFQGLWVDHALTSIIDPRYDALLSLMWLLVLVFALWPARLGAHWARHRTYPLGLLSSRLSFPGFLERKPLNHIFTSPVDARIWIGSYIGNLRLPMFLLITAVLAVPFFLFLYYSFFCSTWFMGHRISIHAYADHIRWYPYVVVIVVASVVGLTRDFSADMWPLNLTPFTRTKPMSNAYLAWTHLIAIARIFFACLLLLFMLSNTLYAFFFYDDFSLMLSSLHWGNILMPLAFFMEPLFWACVLTWLALTCLRPLVFAFGSISLLAFLYTLLAENPFEFYSGDSLTRVALRLPLQLAQNTFLEFDGRYAYIYLYILCFFLLARSAILYRRAWHDRLFTRKNLGVMLLAHVALTVFMWWPGPNNVYAAISSFYLTLTFITLLLSPLVALPYWVARKRTLV